MQASPFSRAKAMMAAIAAVIASAQGNTAMQQAGLAAIGPYQSRGHGKGQRTKAPHGAQMAHIRAARKARRVKRHKAALRGRA